MPDEPDTRARLGIPCRAQPHLWHSTRPDEISQAIEACGHCPVLSPWCETQLAREQTLPASSRHGVWAGVLITPPLPPSRRPVEPRQGTHLRAVPPCSESPRPVSLVQEHR